MKASEVKHGLRVRLGEYEAMTTARLSYLGKIATVDLQRAASNREFPWVQLSDTCGLWWRCEGLIAVGIERRAYSAWRQMLPKHRRLQRRPTVADYVGEYVELREVRIAGQPVPQSGVIHYQAAPAPLSRELLQAREALAQAEGRYQYAILRALDPFGAQMSRAASELAFCRDRLARLEEAEHYAAPIVRAPASNIPRRER